jgi:hypothetical protein
LDAEEMVEIEEVQEADEGTVLVRPSMARAS